MSFRKQSPNLTSLLVTSTDCWSFRAICCSCCCELCQHSFDEAEVCVVLKSSKYVLTLSKPFLLCIIGDALICFYRKTFYFRGKNNLSKNILRNVKRQNLYSLCITRT